MNAPRTLGIKGKDFWKGIMADWLIDQRHDLELLEQASICLDRLENARNAMERDGEYIEVHGKLTAHPGLKVERECLALFNRLVKALDLTTDQEKPGSNFKKGRGIY